MPTKWFSWIKKKDSCKAMSTRMKIHGVWWGPEVCGGGGDRNSRNLTPMAAITFPIKTLLRYS